MSGGPVRARAAMLAGMDPVQVPGAWVFATVDELPDVPVRASVVEDEGTSVLLAQGDADALGLPYAMVGALLTLRVHSALDGVGLTAAVATELATAGIACNVVAGHHHDHLVVPATRADEALRLLRGLASRHADGAAAPPPPDGPRDRPRGGGGAAGSDGPRR